MKVNKCIGCTVKECKYHAKNQNYCCLDHIDVDKQQNNVKSSENTICGSFISE